MSGESWTARVAHACMWMLKIACLDSERNRWLGACRSLTIC